jgi:chemotaxis protein CheD
MVTNSIVHVNTGEVKCGSYGIELIANGIGSCVVVAACDASIPCGGMAHIMLPGSSPDRSQPMRFRYAEDALTELFRKMRVRGAHPERTRIALVGGGNVLHRPDDTICEQNIASVQKGLITRAYEVVAHSLGGTLRRRARLNIRQAQLYYSQGESKETLLCSLQ